MSKIPVSSPQNLWSDAQSVDDGNLTLEQNFNNEIYTSLINNHIGSGVIPEALSQAIIFDSSLSGDLLDGKFIAAQVQPSDSNNGNQLEIELTGSLAAGNKTVKVILIGLDFQNTLQYDTLVFAKNESQITKRHYRTVLAIFLNDFIGAPLQSFNLGGRITIKESLPMSLSRDPLMIAQDVEPNLVFRDFFVASGTTLSNLLATSLPSYNISGLNIKTGYRQLRSIVQNDVSTQIGQKFLSTSNNIQKISLLLAVNDNITPSNSVWTGDLIVSIYALQSTIQSSTDIVPNLAIDFDPTNIPLAQISLDYAGLLASGIQLNTSPQPVDFIFSNTPVGSGLLVKSGSYYVITIKRAGSADTSQIQIATGSNASEDMRETIFNGSIWVDIPEESLWFRAFTDAAKVSDGQAYDSGKGIQISKTIIDDTTGLTIDNSLDNQSFLRNDLYSAVIQALLKEFAPVQNQRTGNPIDSEKEYVPALSLLTNTQLSAIQAVSEPLILGTITDQNIKSSSVTGSIVGAAIHHYGMIGNEIVMKVIDDVSDTFRYDQNLVAMVSDLVAGKLGQAKFIPNTSNPSIFYRIVKAELLTLMYGDINGDGIIDNADLLASQRLLGTDLNVFPSLNTYQVHTADFAPDSSIHWQVVDPTGPTVITSGTDGILSAFGDTANFNSASASFSTISGLGTYQLKVLTSTTTTNIGSFSIINLVDTNDITIQKVEYTTDLFLQLMRADINNDMIVDSADVSLITNYIELAPPFPATSLPANRVGTTFNAIRFTVDQYVDRNDDYPGTDANRASIIHPAQDIFLDGYSSWGSSNVKTSPINFSIVKQLNWNEDNIVVNSNPKMVPASFNFLTGYNSILGATNLNQSLTFPIKPSFDPGRNDMFIPNNLIINAGGQITNPTGDYFKMDFEMNTISFEIPPVAAFNGEKTVNILTDFIADYTTTGYTRIGYKALRFADGSTVPMTAFTSNQVRVDASVLSFSPQINGITTDGYEGILINPSMGVSMDYSTGLLTLNFNGLFKDPVTKTENTKVQISVYLKKAGWNNAPTVIDSSKTTNLLGL